jgi:hypothetical protein
VSPGPTQTSKPSLNAPKYALFHKSLTPHVPARESERAREEGGGRREIEEKVFNITIIMKDET